MHILTITSNLMVIMGILYIPDTVSGQYNYTYSNILTVNDSLVHEPFFRTAFKNILYFIRAPFHRIMPGTLWCGNGNMSNTDEKLGMRFRTDSCCREHDHCDMNIRAGETRYGLTNTASYTKSACHCDHKFYSCLKTVNSLSSRKIGRIFFNNISPTCFVFDYPVISCNKTSWSFFRTKCTAYNRNTNAPRIWQWIDNWIF